MLGGSGVVISRVISRGNYDYKPSFKGAYITPLFFTHEPPSSSKLQWLGALWSSWE